MVPGAMTEATAPLSPGVVIAETYEIERQLGQGGMGEVWLATHRRLAGKQVAIKVLHVDRQLPQEALARFKREAEIAARLEHPNIVHVSDFSTLPTGEPYLVMEYLKGQSLAARVKGKTLPLEQVVLIMRQVGAALQAAHRAGVVHRDLKPENIFLVPTALGDQVKVLDFGISKMRDSNTVQTTDSVLIGTPLYMSPEQALGNNKEVTAQSDLFSLGSICYELLTGKAPFSADNIAKVVFRIAYEKHPPLASLRPDLPKKVVDAVEHALEKDREKRTAGIEAFVEELTGQGLAEVAQDESSGVFSPGMSATPSMDSGKTRAAPVTGAPGYAPSPMDSAGTVSGKKVMTSLVVGAVLLAAIVVKVRMDNWAERAVYRAGMVDAGWVMLEDGNFVRDAGPMDAGEAPVVVVAAVPELLDAGVPPDAGLAVVAPLKPKPEVPPTEAELQVLERLRGLAAKSDWDGLWDSRNTMRLKLQTPSARSQGLTLVVEAACARHDNSNLLPLVAELRLVTPAAQVALAKKKCTAVYADAASVW